MNTAVGVLGLVKRKEGVAEGVDARAGDHAWEGTVVRVRAGGWGGVRAVCMDSRQWPARSGKPVPPGLPGAASKACMRPPPPPPLTPRRPQVFPLGEWFTPCFWDWRECHRDLAIARSAGGWGAVGAEGAAAGRRRVLRVSAALCVPRLSRLGCSSPPTPALPRPLPSPFPNAQACTTAQVRLA